MNITPDYCRQRVLVLGCGNILFGDDGFGPRVAEALQKDYSLPGDVGVIDAGTGVRKILFDVVLSEERPEKVIIVDAVDVGRPPGEVFEIQVDSLPENKAGDFSMHQLPTSNLLKELREQCKVDVRIIATQAESIPEQVSMGLSRRVADCVPAACEAILKELG